MAVKKGLGKGLDSLIPAKTVETKAEEDTLNREGVIEVNINEVEPNKKQPRKKFDEEALQELSDSIKSKGIISPILVQKRDGYYEIIAGERRWRAARKAGLTEVPVIIKDLTEKEIFEISLIENIQREQLNPIEEALAYKRLSEEFSLTQEQIAERVSKSRSVIANSMRLLRLEESVQQMVVDGDLSFGHVRAILGIENAKEQIEFAKKAVENKMNVREVEAAIRSLQEKTEKKPSKTSNSKPELDAIYAEIEDRLKDVLGTKVKLHIKELDRGSLEIEYYSKDQLEHIIDKLES